MPKDAPKLRSPALANLQAKLRNAGLKCTEPRLAVLRVLEGASAPMSHGDIAETLAKEGFDRATLYRNLMDLAEAGLVNRTDLGDHIWRFELQGDEGRHDAHHPHFVCTDCGDIECLPGVQVSITAPKTAPRSVRSETVAVHIKGKCDRCA